ncbi:pyridoxamine 5'-phosphate oxidase family protein [Microbacterium cremeum]|uniref:pyridoxamine 5'-phosphate oxidase family protein n=1 Tax=Microbacterium cremeum TaxID=2782169 RepID=UPI001887EE64|nr:pyridoxamine 5'-phosphate oxidase family protein [Microbacterium cremeum]
MPEPRDRVTRKADLLAALTAPAADVWGATAAPDATPYLVPLSLAWIDERAVVSLDAASPTARNIEASRIARLAVGPTRDVALIDATLERSVGVDDDAQLGEAYAAQADWDPRGLAGYTFLVLRPTRIQAWRESNELAGRLLMRDGEWLV